MKSRKLIIASIITILLTVQCMFEISRNFVYAEENKTIETSINKVGETDLTNLVPGQEFEVIARIGNFTNVSEGLVTLSGQLEYNSSLLTREEITGQNGWTLGKFINESNFKFVVDNGEVIKGQSDLLKIKFRVNNTLTEDVNTTIKIKNILASGGSGVVRSNDAVINLSVKIPQVGITSEKYLIQDNIISRIAPGTTLAKFKENVVAYPDVVILDKEGNALASTDIIKTGMTVKVGENLTFTAVVTGDIDGRDGIITTNDLAQIKLHLIETEGLGAISSKAADLDNDGVITINDVAQIKLVLIGLMTIE